MSLTGSLDDVSVADVMQFIHLGGRSGTLTLIQSRKSKEPVRPESQKRAEIGFHRGRIISARGPEHLPLGEWLVRQGALSPGNIDAALRVQKRMPTPTALGKVLLEMGLIDVARLKELVERQIETTVYGIVGWTGGTFEFSLDELKPIDDLSMSPGDILPDININTQMVLLEAARILDERNRADIARSNRPSSGDVERDEHTTDPTQLAPKAAIESKPAAFRTQLISSDHDLFQRVERALCVSNASVVRVTARDAGTRMPGEAAPIVIVDLRSGIGDIALFTSIRRTRPRATLIAIVDDPGRQLEAYEHGALAVLPADPYVIAACTANALHLSDNAAQAQAGAARSPAIAKLTRVFGEMRSGLLTATVSLNLMNLVSESVERAVLFMAAPTRLVVLGAYGYTALDQSLAEHSRQFQIPMDQAGVLADSLRDSRSRSISYDEARLPESFTALIGRPSSGSCAVFPLLGSRKVIATMYVDNGRRHTPIDDTELLEIATSQVGMFYENELLRRQLAQYAKETSNKLSMP
jgi:hypothetical protein